MDTNSQLTSKIAAPEPHGCALPLNRPGFLPIRTSFLNDENAIPKSMFSPFTPATPFAHSSSPNQESSAGYFDRPGSRREPYSLSKTALNVVVREGEVDDVDHDDIKDGWGTARQMRAEILDEWQSSRDELCATTSTSGRAIASSRSPLLARVLSFSSSSLGNTPMAAKPRALTRPRLCKTTTNYELMSGHKNSTINSTFEFKQAILL